MVGTPQGHHHLQRERGAQGHPLLLQTEHAVRAAGKKRKGKQRVGGEFALEQGAEAVQQLIAAQKRAQQHGQNLAEYHEPHPIFRNPVHAVQNTGTGGHGDHNQTQEHGHLQLAHTDLGEFVVALFGACNQLPLQLPQTGPGIEHDGLRGSDLLRLCRFGFFRLFRHLHSLRLFRLFCRLCKIQLIQTDGIGSEIDFPLLWQRIGTVRNFQPNRIIGNGGFRFGSFGLLRLLVKQRFQNRGYVRLCPDFRIETIAKFFQNVFQIQFVRFRQLLLFFIHGFPSSGFCLIPTADGLLHRAEWRRRRKRSGTKYDPSWGCAPAYHSFCAPAGSCRRLRCR